MRKGDTKSSGTASIFSGRPLSRSERLQIAALVGIAAGMAAFLAFSQRPEMLARDFTYPWRGAQAILGGQNPYDVVRPTGDPPYDMWFMYPLTAALAALPLAPLQVQTAGVAFSAVGAAALTFAITASGIGAMWMLCSVPFLMAVVLAQWSPLLIAAAVLTPLAGLLSCKPIGLALLAWRPSWKAAAGCAVLVGLAFLVQPSWLVDWIRNARTVSDHPAPVFHPLGWLPLLAFLRWREPSARLIGIMALIPQNLYFYDQLPLLLVARRGRQTLLLAALSWVAWWFTARNCALGFFCGPEARVPILALLYVPATLLVLIDSQTIGWLKRLARGRFAASSAITARRAEDPGQ